MCLRITDGDLGEGLHCVYFSYPYVLYLVVFL